MEQRHDDNSVVSSEASEYDALRNVTKETPCPYLPDRSMRSEVYVVGRLSGAMHESLLARGFRRSGNIVYRPRCRGCGECRQFRLPIAQFRPSKSMRRVWRKNVDIRVEVAEPTITPEKHDIFKRYLDGQHDSTMDRSQESFRAFLYGSPTETIEFTYLLGDRVVGVSITDVCPNGLSSVYMYFDPDFAARSLGTFSILREIEHCRSANLAYYYLGFYVAQSKTMDYKSRFRPNQVLVAEGRWLSFCE